MASVMQVTALIAQSYLLATGKVTALTTDSTKYTKLLALANYYQLIWANEPDTDWNVLRSNFNLGTVTATNSFAIPTTVGKISHQEGDFVRITSATQEYDYDLVLYNELYSSDRKLNHWDNGRCAVAGSNLVFSHTFATTDPQFGGAITLPGFTIPATLVNSTDVVTVPDPNWLCQMVAAEYVRTDLTRQAQYPSLIAMANESMRSMKEQNDSQIEQVYMDWSPTAATSEDPWSS
jgi:hypothetical protein